MGYNRNKLDRQTQNEIAARYGDSFKIVEYEGTLWIVLQDKDGDDILRVYGVESLLDDLYIAIGRRLRKAPEATIGKLREVHRLLDDILKREEAGMEEAAYRRCWGPEASAAEEPGVSAVEPVADAVLADADSVVLSDAAVPPPKPKRRRRP